MHKNDKVVEMRKNIAKNGLERPTRHAPCFEVQQICTEAYLKDIQGHLREVRRIDERIEALTTLDGVDYSRYIGAGKVPNTKGNEKMLDAVASVQCFIEAVETSRKVVEDASELVHSVPHGDVLWLRFVEGERCDILARANGVNRRTINRWITEATRATYAVMPEEYRRYSIPNSI